MIEAGVSMRLEYFEDGFDGGPLILLYGGSLAEVRRLCEEFFGLAQAPGNRAAVHSLPFVEILNKSTLTAFSAHYDDGVILTKPGEFEWSLRPGSWVEVSELLQPFGIPAKTTDARFQHLNRYGGPKVVYSTDRTW